METVAPWSGKEESEWLVVAGHSIPVDHKTRFCQTRTSDDQKKQQKSNNQVEIFYFSFKDLSFGIQSIPPYRY